MTALAARPRRPVLLLIGGVAGFCFLCGLSWVAYTAWLIVPVGLPTLMVTLAGLVALNVLLRQAGRDLGTRIAFLLLAAILWAGCLLFPIGARWLQLRSEVKCLPVIVDCPVVGVDIAALAADDFPGYRVDLGPTTYAAAVAAVSEYHRQLPQHGWQAWPIHRQTDQTGSTTSCGFKKPGRSLSVTAWQGHSGSLLLAVRCHAGNLYYKIKRHEAGN